MGSWRTPSQGACGVCERVCACDVPTHRGWWAGQEALRRWWPVVQSTASEGPDIDSRVWQYTSTASLGRCSARREGSLMDVQVSTCWGCGAGGGSGPCQVRDVWWRVRAGGAIESLRDLCSENTQPVENTRVVRCAERVGGDDELVLCERTLTRCGVSQRE